MMHRLNLEPAGRCIQSQRSPEEEAVLEAGFQFAELAQTGESASAVGSPRPEQIRCRFKPDDPGFHLLHAFPFPETPGL